MKAIHFKEANIEFAKDQPEYKVLPAFYDKNNGIAVSCYKMSFRERLKVLFTGVVWLSTKTFGQNLCPQKLDVDKSEVFVNPMLYALALGLHAMSFGVDKPLGVPITQMKFAPHKPDKGKTISAGKPKKKPFGERNLSKKECKKRNAK